MSAPWNAKRRFSFWAAVTCFTVAILCAIEAKTGGSGDYRALALGAFVFGLISAAGVWANGLAKGEDPDSAESH